MFFYGWDAPLDLAVLAVSIGFNFCVGQWMFKWSGEEHEKARRQLLFWAVLANVVFLGVYKYTRLPLGLSFFTFSQLTYLVDQNEEPEKIEFFDYCLFVSFFPYVVAGPIHTYREIIPQFAKTENSRFNARNLTVGGAMFLIGLFKKVIFADGVSGYATPVFNVASQGTPLAFFQSWTGVLAFALQLYFDFSGYCDMALGLGIMMGFKFRINFESPFKARNIIEFWLHWHSTLTRFLTNYIFNPMILALSRWRAVSGKFQSAAAEFFLLVFFPIMVTMFIAGLWHGAGWKFIAYGCIHGAYLVLNHAWRKIHPKSGGGTAYVLSRAVTFVAVVASLIFFRSDNVPVALGLLRGMIGLNGISLPKSLGSHFQGWESALASVGIVFRGMTLSTLGDTVLCIVGLLIVVQFFPNSQQILSRFEPALNVSEHSHRNRLPEWALWKPTVAWGLVMGFIAALSVIGLSRVSDFIYFQF